MDFLKRFWRKVHAYVIPTKHNAYRPRLLHSSWLIFFLALILTAEAVLLTNIFAGQSARTYLAAVLPLEVVELTNLERGFNNVRTLTESLALKEAAEHKARDMAAKGYFSHVGPDGKEPWVWLTEAGYAYGTAGENLAVRFNESADVVEAWMASPSHRANIVKPTYTEIGVGVAEGTYKGAPATFVVQYFGRPLIASLVAETPAPAETGSSQVLGAATDGLAKETVAKVVAGLGAAPSTQALGLLGGVAVLLLVLVSLAFLVNIQVQPVDLLLGGAGVAAVAVAFLVLNFSYARPFEVAPQTANVFTATRTGVLLGEDGATTPLEPEVVIEASAGLPTETLKLPPMYPPAE